MSFARMIRAIALCALFIRAIGGPLPVRAQKLTCGDTLTGPGTLSGAVVLPAWADTSSVSIQVFYDTPETRAYLESLTGGSNNLTSLDRIVEMAWKIGPNLKTTQKRTIQINDMRDDALISYDGALANWKCKGVQSGTYLLFAVTNSSQTVTLPDGRQCGRSLKVTYSTSIIADGKALWRTNVPFDAWTVLSASNPTTCPNGTFR